MSSLWEFLFRYPPVVYDKGRLVFATPLPQWMLLSAAALVALAAWTYVRWRGATMRRRDRMVLLVVRGALFAVLLFILFRPTLQVPAAVPQENYLGILIDDSRSMRIADGEEGPRSAQVRGQLDASTGELLRALSARYRLRLFRFSGNAERIGGIEEMSFSGGQSRLGRALDQVRGELAGVPLAGLVLISDGADGGEAELNASLLGLRTARLPVFTVGVGRERFERDIEVRRASTPRAVLKGAALVVDVVVAQTGFGGRKVPLVVEDQGRIVASHEIELPPDGTPAVARVHFAASEAGWRRLRYRIPEQEGELVRENNAQDALIEVRDGPQKILYLEGEPRFEVKFLRRAVEDDPQLQLVVLQRTADNKFLRLHVDSAAELASGFPRTREELFSYRGLILGSVEAGFFTPDQLRMISDFVAERGGGLLVLGGRRSFAEGGYAGTPLADVLPVVLEERSGGGFFAEIAVQPTRAGLTHPALQLAEDAAASRQRWATLPRLTTFNRITRLKPGATALLTGTGPEAPAGQIVLASQRYGRGLSLALPVQDTWMWQMHAEVPLEDQTHEVFWKQVLRWLVNEVPGQMTSAASAEPAAVEQPVSIHAQLRDEAYRSVNDARVAAWVEGPDGAAREVPMRWTMQRAGEYVASFAPGAPGLHRLRLEARRGDGTLATTSLALDAVDDEGEYFAAQMRAPLLRRVAEETGGRFYTMSSLSRLPQEIRFSGQGVTSVERYDLWDLPVLFVLLIGLMAIEWAYRRTRGLP